MAIFEKISISILTSLTKEFVKYSIKELMKNLKFVKVLKRFGLTTPKDNFTNLYSHSLIKFSDEISNMKLLEVFKHKDVVSAFEESIKNKDDKFERILNKVLITDQKICKIPELKKLKNVPKNDISKFILIFENLRNEIKTPLETEVTDKLDDNSKMLEKIGEKVDELLNKPSRLNTEESKINVDEILHKFQLASIELSNYKDYFYDLPDSHIDRDETNQIFEWINKDLPIEKPKIAILVGKPGYGKSVVLKDLQARLNESNIPTLGLKADRLVYNSRKELEEELNLEDGIEKLFNKVSNRGQKTVLIVDQLDALSQSLSSNRNSLNVFNKLINRLSFCPNVRIIISCREYDLSYDPYLHEYQNKQVFNIQLLKQEKVNEILRKLGCNIPLMSKKLIDFLRVPLNLDVYCKVYSKDIEINHIRSLQDLYDELWNQKILNIGNNEINSQKAIELIFTLSNEMYEKQTINLPLSKYENKFTTEISYLTSVGILSNENRILQFSHQTFFDYAYARFFLENKISISFKILGEHQGLFIRSRIKQIISYLREVDIEKYIFELETILLSKKYRFHIKLLLINQLAYQNNIKRQEKEFVKNKIFTNEELKVIFIESVFNEEWFDFIRETEILKSFISDKEIEKSYYLISNLISKQIRVSPTKTLQFLKDLPNFKYKSKLIEDSFFSLSDYSNNLVYELFEKIEENLDDFRYYHYLERTIPERPDWVIEKMRNKFYLHKINKDVHIDYLPGGHEVEQIYKDLFNKFPDKAYPFFIEIIKKIASDSSPIKNGIKRTFYSSLAFYYYAPKEEYHDLLDNIYSWTIEYLKNKINDKEFIIKEVKALLESEFIAVLNIGLSIIIKEPRLFIDQTYNLFKKEKFFLDCQGMQLFDFNVKEVLRVSFPIFSELQKTEILEDIITIIPEWEKKVSLTFIKPKGISKYGYLRYGLTKYQYLSVLPIKDLKFDKVIWKEFQELERKFGIISIEEPKGIQITRGERILPQKAYDNMTFSHWIKSFKSYTNISLGPFEKVSEVGHYLKFSQEISINPDKFFPLVAKIIDDKKIPDSYIVYGLQGLSDSNYSPEEVKRLFKYALKIRNFNKEYTFYLVWFTEYFIKTKSVDNDIIKFLSDRALNYPEEEMLSEDPLTDGLKSVRGSSVDRLIKCYVFKEFKEDIFIALESIAKEASIPTKACALNQMAYLNHLDKERNLNLFLDFFHDYNRLLLKIHVTNGHPFMYLIHVDFKKLLPFIKKCILIAESHVMLTYGLYSAWLQDYDQSEKLFYKLLISSIEAQKKAVEISFELIEKEKYFNKSLIILNKFLNSTNKEISKAYEHGFHHLPPNKFEDLYEYIKAYISSEVGKHKGYSFLEFIKKSVIYAPKECIEIAQSFLNYEFDYYSRSEPIQIILNAYNVLKEYKNKTDLLEYAMNVFDEMLQKQQMRGIAYDVLNKVDN